MLETMSKNLQRKCCQGPPTIAVEPLQSQQIACPSNPALPMGTKQVARSMGGANGGEHNHYFVFNQKEDVLLTMRRFNKNHWRPSLKILHNVPSIGSGAGIAASSRRGSTS